MASNRFWQACLRFSPAVAGLVLLTTQSACDAGARTEDDSAPPPATVLPSLFGTPTHTGSGTTTQQFTMSDVKRNDVY
jgi:hypothetical protein